jgi:hypothetical protein
MRRPNVPGHAVLLALCLVLSGVPGLAGCTWVGGEPPGPATSSGEFAGYWTGGFEVSSFVTCEMETQPGYGKGWWLESDDGVGFGRRVQDVLGPRATEPYTPGAGVRQDLIVFVRFVGTVERDPNGRYGHIGAYRGQVMVHRVLELAADPHGCEK